MSRVGVDRPATERPGIREDPGAPETSETPETSVDGRTRRWDSHRAARRTELTLAARKAVHHGGPELSMDEIAAAIGTSKSIVYRYFSDRAGLQRAVGEAVLHDLGTALADASHGAATPEGALRAMVGVYLEMVAASPSVYLFVTNRDERGAEDASAPMRVLAHDTAELPRAGAHPGARGRRSPGRASPPCGPPASSASCAVPPTSGSRNAPDRTTPRAPPCSPSPTPSPTGSATARASRPTETRRPCRRSHR
ncbi:TetR/AcrR family transcriptional regulator [Salana multivorans]